MSMFITRKHLSRRATLKGLGVSVALPLLDAMIPAATAMAQTAAVPKQRVGFFYIPHGAIMDNTPLGKEVDAWTPSGEGESFTLNRIMRPLEKYKQQLISFAHLEMPPVPDRCTPSTRRPGSPPSGPTAAPARARTWPPRSTS
jgi:hypothetical protein